VIELSRGRSRCHAERRPAAKYGTDTGSDNPVV
jgi:hypothetical protein